MQLHVVLDCTDSEDAPKVRGIFPEPEDAFHFAGCLEGIFIIETIHAGEVPIGTNFAVMRPH